MVQTEAEAAAAAAATAPATAAVNFSMELNDEQRQMQKWVHDFAKDVIRPVAHEWDERDPRFVQRAACDIQTTTLYLVRRRRTDNAVFHFSRDARAVEATAPD